MKSGEFAKLCGTTKNTLIHYDQMGLLHPSLVGDNGYRYYTYSDVTRFVAIKTFSEAGFTLKQVKTILDNSEPASLALAAKENGTVLSKRISELERAAALLHEIATQAEAVADDASVNIKDEPERMLLVMKTSKAVRQGDDLSLLWNESNHALEALSLIGPRAELAPYGFTSWRANGDLVYESAYFLLPSDIKIPKTATRYIETVEDLSLVPKPSGRYLELGYFGSWENITKAYEQLILYASKNDLCIFEPYYEISMLRLLDDAEGKRYRAIVSVRF